MNKELKSLSEHEEEAHRLHSEILRLRMNGIACPKCGKELKDGDSVYLTSPAQKDVFCDNCGFKSTRTV